MDLDYDLRPVESLKEFAVVKFLQSENELDQYSEVLVKWLRYFKDINDKIIYKCWWPPTIMNVTSLLLKRSDHDSATWFLLEVEIDKFCSSMTSARKRAGNGNYSSTDHETLGKGYRSKISRNLSVDEDMENYTQAPKKKKVRHNSSNSMNFHNTDDDEQLSTILAPLPEEPDFGDKDLLTQADTSKHASYRSEDVFEHKNIDDNNGKIQSHIEKVVRLCAHMRLELKDVKNRLSLVEKGNNEKSILNEMENIKALLPLRKVAYVDEFNKKLKTSQETKLLFEKYILRIGGPSAKENIYNVLKTVFSNKCCKYYTWKERKQKPAA
ncbi:uncharacterized protein LOC122505446 [Leptopilina heterotoma]|uniref:uncharacterized protein LOC122505446 n=1 Tax=Leptopilina heterotoma TaxID=63436 RepID=UPI001CAA099C|nr:uncharacterized protein LOC122505446 [Leptopilina heterotoma]